jgi:hypothetical protein
MKRYFLAALLVSGFAVADNAEEDYLKIALGTKAIMDAGYDISNMLGVDLLYVPDFTTRDCVFVTTEIVPNPGCPDLFPQEKSNRGFMSCVKLDGSRQTFPGGIQSLCK